MADDREVYSEEFVPREAVGFTNSGNYCWFNSLLQFLVGLSAINKILLSKEPEDMGRFAQTYASMIRASIERADVTTQIEQLKNQFGTFATSRGMSMSDQNCAHEGFMLFVELIGLRSVEVALNVHYLRDLKCPCGISSRQRIMRTWADIEADIIIRDDKDFVSYLKRHETLVCDYMCEAGVKHRELVAPEQLARIGDVIIVLFKNYYIKSQIRFPKRINIPALKGGSAAYELVGAVEQMGSMGGGHYTARTKRGNNVWLCDDSRIEVGDFTPSSNTYFIAYHFVGIE